MLRKIVLCISQKQATAGLWRMGKLMSCGEFPDHEAGHEGFRKWLHQYRSTPISVIVDTAEEDFRLETIPHVAARSRKEILDRRLNQHYRNAGFRAAQQIDRETAGRRDDRFLLMALTNPEVVSTWISIAQRLQMPLAGIYLAPVVSKRLGQLLSDALPLPQGDLLLVTRQHAGLRQSFFRGPALHFSRLSPLPDQSIPNFQQRYVVETEKTLLYLLDTQTNFSQNRMHLMFAATQDADVDAAQHVPLTQNIDRTVIKPSELARYLGLDSMLLQRHPDLMLMQVLACHGFSATNIAPGKLMRPLQLQRIGLSLNIASAACLSGAAVMAAANIASAYDMEHQSNRLAAQIRTQERLHPDTPRSLPATPWPGGMLKTVSELAQNIDSLNRTPQRMMQIVGEALDRQPEIRLDRLRWQLTDKIDGTDDASIPAPLASFDVHEIGFIEGEIANFDGNYRAALDSVNRLAEQLKNHRQVHRIEILRQPLDTSPLANLQGSTREPQTGQAPSAPFKLKIVLKAVPR